MWVGCAFCIKLYFVNRLLSTAGLRPLSIGSTLGELWGAAIVTFRAGPSEIGVRPTLAGTQQKPLSTGKTNSALTESTLKWVSQCCSKPGWRALLLSQHSPSEKRVAERQWINDLSRSLWESFVKCFRNEKKKRNRMAPETVLGTKKFFFEGISFHFNFLPVQFEKYSGKYEKCKCAHCSC